MISSACRHCGVQQFGFLICTQCGKHDPRGEMLTTEKTGEANTKYKLEGGSTRSEKAPPYHLVPPVGPRRIAWRFGLGAEKHGEGNWKKSIHESEQAAAAFCKEAYNHMTEHAAMSASGDIIDDHLGAIGWGVCVLAYAEQFWGKPWREIGEYEEKPNA